MVKNTIKAISPVAASALLLVVAVVAVVGFQPWFNTYQSGLNTKVEQESNQGSSITIERVEAIGVDLNTTIYLKNTATSNVLITDLKVVKDGTTYCTQLIDQNATASTVTPFYWANCTGGALVSGVSYNVVAVSSTGVYQATHLAR